MAVQSKTVKGQPYIMNDQLLQDQILLVTSDNKTVRTASGTEVIVDNIWDDLLSTSGKWKRKKNYFYWEVEVSDTLDDRGTDATVQQMIECPRPTPELFNYDFSEDSSDSEWAAFWKSKFLTVYNSPYNGVNAVYKKEVILPGTKYIKFGNILSRKQDEPVTGDDDIPRSEEIVINQATVDMDDTMNLLSSQESSIGTDLSDINGLLNSLI